MPYIPAEDRPPIDEAVEKLARLIADKIIVNSDLTKEYANAFEGVSFNIINKLKPNVLSPEAFMPESAYEEMEAECQTVAAVVLRIAEKYGYDGAYLGGLNYAITRLIQRVPEIKVEQRLWEQKLRYWIVARTVGALASSVNFFIVAALQNQILGGTSIVCTLIDFAGVFTNIKDEYYRRVVAPYEDEQMRKNGDCYDMPDRKLPPPPQPPDVARNLPPTVPASDHAPTVPKPKAVHLRSPSPKSQLKKRPPPPPSPRPQPLIPLKRGGGSPLTED